MFPSPTGEEHFLKIILLKMAQIVMKYVRFLLSWKFVGTVSSEWYEVEQQGSHKNVESVWGGGELKYI